MTSRIRRRLLGAAAALPFARPALAQDLPLTPACGPEAALTPRQSEGPFYTPNTPLRASLVEPGTQAERLVLTGRVVSAQCRPVAGALLDFWHCDEHGAYDNAGFRYRGHLFADAEGRFRLETIFPRFIPAARATFTSRCRRRAGASSPRSCISRATRATACGAASSWWRWRGSRRAAWRRSSSSSTPENDIIAPSANRPARNT